MDINEIISNVVISIIALVITGVAIPLIKRAAGVLDKKLEELKGTLTANELNLLNQFISIAVKGAEQIYKSEEYKEKKESVVKYVNELIGNGTLKLQLTTDQLDTIIEGIVYEVKKELKKTDTTIPTEPTN